MSQWQTERRELSAAAATVARTGIEKCLLLKKVLQFRVNVFCVDGQIAGGVLCFSPVHPSYSSHGHLDGANFELIPQLKLHLAAHYITRIVNVIFGMEYNLKVLQLSHDHSMVMSSASGVGCLNGLKATS